MSVNATEIESNTAAVCQTNSTMGEFVQLIGNTFHLDQFASEAIVALSVFLFSILITWTVERVFERYFTAWAQKTRTELDNKILHNVKTPIFLVALLLGAYYSLETLSLLSGHLELIRGIFIVAEIFAVSFMLTRVASIIVAWYGERRAKQDMAVSSHLLFVFNKLIQLAILVGALLAILWAFNVNLSGLVVGLGVGGIAIALAVQSTLSDVLSAFSIYFDRPFEIGDFVVVGEHAGTVTKIGIKSTRLMLLQGEELVLPNQVLTSTNLRNFRKLQKRRVVFNVGVTYDTPSEKLQKIPSLIEQVIRSVDLVEFDRAHFQAFGDFSLKFEVVYYVTLSAYTKYMDVQQEINLGIKKVFEQEGIQIALPSQRIYFTK